MKGAGKVVSKSYSWACNVELAEKSNILQIWSICLLITSGYNEIALFEGIKNLLFLLSNNVCSLQKMQKTQPNVSLFDEVDL